MRHWGFHNHRWRPHCAPVDTGNTVSERWLGPGRVLLLALLLLPKTWPNLGLSSFQALYCLQVPGSWRIRGYVFCRNLSASAAMSVAAGEWRCFCKSQVFLILSDLSCGRIGGDRQATCTETRGFQTHMLGPRRVARSTSRAATTETSATTSTTSANDHAGTCSSVKRK